jgi:hypothetical protein
MLDQYARLSILRLQLFQLFLFSSRHARFEGQAPRGDQRRKKLQTHYQPGQTRCKSLQPLALLSAPLLSPLPDDYLLVTIFLDQTGRRKGTPPTPDLHGRVETSVLLDTGSLAGDLTCQHVVTQLHGEILSYADPQLTTVCSGLDSTCYSSMLLLDVGVQYLTCDNF